MPVYAELADGRRLEFPDGTDPQVVQGAVKRLMADAQARAQAAPDAPNAAQAALIAAGRGSDKIVQGVRQAYNWATGDQKTLDGMVANEAEKDALYKPLSEAHPVATSLGELAPSLAVAPLTGGTSFWGAAGANAIPAFLRYGSAEERLKNAALDGAVAGVGAKGGQLIARVLKPAGVGTEGASKTVLDAAERVGYKPTPAQITQSPGMQAFENYLLRTPGSSGTMQKVASANQTALNRAGARAVGEAADTLDEGVFAAAKSRIGAEFDRLGAATKPQIGDDFINALAKVEADNAARGSFRAGNIDKLVEKGLDLAAKGDLDGKAYKEIRTALSNEAQSAFRSGDATTGQAYKSIRDALDSAAKKSLSESDQKAWDFARDQWQAFKTLSKSNVAEAGNVSAPRAAAAVRSANPSFRTGGMSGDLADIARIGEAFKGVPNPTSGQLAQQMLFSNPITGVPLLLGNKMTAAAYMSPLGQRYFSRGLLDVGQTGEAMLGRAGGLLSVPIGRALLGAE
jgi:hypothetical protein